MSKKSNKKSGENITAKIVFITALVQLIKELIVAISKMTE